MVSFFLVIVVLGCFKKICRVSVLYCILNAKYFVQICFSHSPRQCLNWQNGIFNINPLSGKHRNTVNLWNMLTASYVKLISKTLLFMTKFYISQYMSRPQHLHWRHFDVIVPSFNQPQCLGLAERWCDDVTEDVPALHFGSYVCSLNCVATYSARRKSFWLRNSSGVSWLAEKKPGPWWRLACCYNRFNLGYLSDQIWPLAR